MLFPVIAAEKPLAKGEERSASYNRIENIRRDLAANPVVLRFLTHAWNGVNAERHIPRIREV